MYLIVLLIFWEKKQISWKDSNTVIPSQDYAVVASKKKISKTAAVIIFLLIAVAVCFILFILGDTSKYLRYVLDFSNVFMNCER